MIKHTYLSNPIFSFSLQRKITKSVLNRLIIVLLVITSCRTAEESSELVSVSQEEELVYYYSHMITSEFGGDSMSSLPVLLDENAFPQALESQRKISRLFRTDPVKNIAGVRFGPQEIKKTYEILSSHDLPTDSILSHHFDYKLLKGEQGEDSVHFTGYFTPILSVKKKKDDQYKYPFYKYPKGWSKLPTREEIDTKGHLKNRGLEVAWSNDPFDNFILHVQGSGIVEFEDGTKKILAYNGNNGYEYSSIGKHFLTKGLISPKDISVTAIRNWFDLHPDQMPQILNQNKSYIFFKLMDPVPIGAAGVNLVANYSSAIDTNYIPLGSAMLAEVPKLDKFGDITHYEYQILFAMDRGAAIKGPNRMDIYYGVGDEAFAQANHMNHFGRVWLMVPK